MEKLIIPYGTNPEEVVANMNLIWHDPNFEEKARRVGKVCWSAFALNELENVKEFIEQSKASGFVLAIWRDEEKIVGAWIRHE